MRRTWLMVLGGLLGLWVMLMAQGGCGKRAPLAAEILTSTSWPGRLLEPAKSSSAVAAS